MFQTLTRREANIKLSIYPVDANMGMGVSEDNRYWCVKRERVGDTDFLQAVECPPELIKTTALYIETIDAKGVSPIITEMDPNNEFTSEEAKNMLAALRSGEEIGIKPQHYSTKKNDREVKQLLPHNPTGSTSNMGINTASTRTNKTPMTAQEEGDINRRFKDVTLERDATQFGIPKGMSLEDAIVWLQRKMVEEDRTVGVSERVDCYVLDGAYAFMKAIARTYGFSSLVPTPGFWGDTPPAMISLEVGLDANGLPQTVQVPWGRVMVPGIDGHLDTGFAFTDTGFSFNIRGEVKQKDRHKVAELAALTRVIASQESVYKAQAIRVKFQENPEQFSPSDAPKFMDLRRVNEDDLIFSKDVLDMIRTSIFNPIEHTAKCRQYKIPLKTGVLLAGTFGTGKTLTANNAAKKCVRNGWTCIYLEDVKQLKQGILFAKQYQPALIFAEDIDQVVKGDERDDKVNGILNTIDGIDTKNTEIMVVLTTNKLETINKAMLRPGRLDAVITVTPPDAEAAIKLVHLYGRGLVDANANLEKVGQLLDGQIPAAIQEVVERSKRAALTYLKDGESMKLHPEALEIAAKAMLGHLALLNDKPEPKRSQMEQLGDAMGNSISKGLVKAAQLFPKELAHASEQELKDQKNGTNRHV